MMRLRVCLVAIALGAAGAGCNTPAFPEPGCGTMYEDAARNIIESPIRGCDEAHLKLEPRKLARRAWDAYARTHCDGEASSDFADGFKTGFADYLYEGPPGLPPAVPPFPYQLRRYATPEGHAAIEQWYAGFAAGADVARASGLRDNIVIPLSQPPINAVERRLGGNPAAPPRADPAPAELPAPRPVVPPEAAPRPGG